jgi:hypothetical protein
MHNITSYAAFKHIRFEVFTTEKLWVVIFTTWKYDRPLELKKRDIERIEAANLSTYEVY